MIFLKKVLQKNYKLFAIYLVIKHLLIGGHGSNMVKNISVQPKDIYKDPYGYTYSEMVSVLGENEAINIERSQSKKSSVVLILRNMLSSCQMAIALKR